MARQIIRFTVGTPTNVRSSIWRCFNQGTDSDIYLAPSSIAGCYKVSLHEAGKPGEEWRLAFTKEFQAKLESEGRWEVGADRLVAAWPKSVAIGPGVLLAFRVVVPASTVTLPADPQAQKADLVWIPVPPARRAVEISLILTDAGVVTTGWPGRHKMGTSLVGQMALPNGQVLWVVHREEAIPRIPEMRGTVSKFRMAAGEELKGRDDLRMIVFVEEGSFRALFEGIVERPPGTDENRGSGTPS